MNQEVFYIKPFPEVIQCSTVRIVPVGVVNGKTLSKAKAERLAKTERLELHNAAASEAVPALVPDIPAKLLRELI